MEKVINVELFIASMNPHDMSEEGMAGQIEDSDLTTAEKALVSIFLGLEYPY
jgi:hypothetical protein